VKSGGRVFAAVKGIRDAGVELPAGEEMFPDEHRLEGGHIEEMKDVEATAEFEKVKQQIEEEFE
jgi:large subunit ribosomal protein L18